MNHAHRMRTSILLRCLVFVLASTPVLSMIGEDLPAEMPDRKFKPRPFCDSKPGCSFRPKCDESSDSDAVTDGFISTKPVTLIKKLPYIIRESGVYCLCNSFNLQDCETGVIVQSHDVVLNLNNFCISGGGRGIDIQDCSVNIMVMNGTIKNSAQEAVRISKGSKNIQITQVKAANCNKGMSSCLTSGVINFDGAFLDNIKNSLVKDVLIVNCGGVGVRMNFCNECRIEGTCVQQQASTPQSDAIGFFIQGSSTDLVDCYALKISASHDTRIARGYLIQSSQDIALNGCEAGECIAIAPGTPAAFGFDIESSQCVSCDWCTSYSVNGTIGHGFLAQNALGTLFNNSLAYECSHNGFALIGNADAIINGCTGTLNRLDGFNINTSTDCCVSNNTAERNAANGFTASPVASINFINNFAAANGGLNYSAGISPVQIIGTPSPVLGVNIAGE